MKMSNKLIYALQHIPPPPKKMYIQLAYTYNLQNQE